MGIENVVILEGGTKKVSATDLTAKVGDSDINVRGFCANTKAQENFLSVGNPMTIWLLVTMDDAQSLGEKPCVLAYATESRALAAMKRSIADECLCHGIDEREVSFSNERHFAQSKCGRFSWEVVDADVM